MFSLRIFLISLLTPLMILSCGETEFSSGAAKQEATVSDEAPKDGDVTKKAPPSAETQGAGELPKNEEIVIDYVGNDLAEAIVVEYTSGSLIDSKVTLDLENRTLSQDYTLERAKSVERVERTYTQVKRPPVMETFTQGTAGNNMSENFDQNDYGVLDILIVVDNSGSMNQEQQNLSTKLDPLLTYVKDSDWQIAIVTTDHKDLADPCLRGLIKKGDANASAAFASAIQAGTRGSGNEIGILTSTMAIQCQTKWMRDNSSLAVLIISDEDNCSNGKCGGAAYEDPKYLTDEIAKNRVVGSQARVYGLFHQPGTQCSTAYNVGNVYDALVKSTNGKSGSICDASYSNTLMQISEDVATILEIKFKLATTPDAGSVKVYVDNNLLTSGYTVSGDSVIFATAPAEGAKIRIDYVVGATPRYKSFDLAEEPFLGSVTTMIEGQPETNFVVDYAAKRVTFDTQPGDLTEIRIAYRRNIDLPKAFDIGKLAIEETIKAYVDNSQVAVSDYDANTGILTLGDFPEEEKMVKITFDIPKIGAPIIEFTMTTPWGAVQGLSAKDSDTNEAIGVTYEDGKIKFDPAAFSEGRKVTIIYKDQSAIDNAITLSSAPIESSIQVVGYNADGDVIDCEKDMLEISGNVIITKCDLSDAVKLEAKFQFAVNLQKDFVLVGLEDPNSAIWSVWVDGILSKDYTRKDNVVSFAEELSIGTIVKIEAKFSNSDQ